MCIVGKSFFSEVLSKFKIKTIAPKYLFFLTEYVQGLSVCNAAIPTQDIHHDKESKEIWLYNFLTILFKLLFKLK